MNERIRELAEQAGMPTITATRLGVQATLYDKNLLDVEKFAELIVRRVISVYNDTDTFKTSTYDDQRVLKYFGVEE